MSSLANRLGTFLRSHAQPPALLFFGGIFLVSQLSIAVVLAPVGLDHTLAMQTTLSVDEFTRLVEDMFRRGAADAYVAHYYYDFLHPFWYSAGLALLLGWLMERNDLAPRWNGWLLLPFLAGLGDEIENALHLYMVLDTANIAAPLVVVANGASLMKWAIVAAGSLAVAALAVRALLTHNK